MSPRRKHVFRAAAAAPPPLDEQARRLADKLPAAVYVSPEGIPGSFVYMSAAVERMLGRPPSAWLADHRLWLASLHPDERWAAAAAKTRRGRGDLEISYRLRDARGGWRWVRDVSSTGIAEGFVVGTWTDLTEERRLDAELERERRESGRMRAQIGRLMSAASHTLRTPSRQIVSLADIAARRAVDPEVARLLRPMRDAAERFERRLGLIALFTEAVLSAPRIEDVCANAALEAALRDVAPLARSKGGLVTADRLPFVRADPSRLRELLHRLLDNALRYGGQAPRAHVFSARVGGDCVISVRDHGPGIEPGKLRLLLSSFDASERAEGGGGPSLGLAVCREFAESMGGRLWADSEPGFGSTFSFSVPCAESVP